MKQKLASLSYLAPKLIQKTTWQETEAWNLWIQWQIQTMRYTFWIQNWKPDLCNQNCTFAKAFWQTLTKDLAVWLILMQSILRSYNVQASNSERKHIFFPNPYSNDRPKRLSTTREKFHNHVYERAQSGIKEQLCHDISSDTCGKMSMEMARVSRPQNKRSGNRKED